MTHANDSLAESVQVTVLVADDDPSVRETARARISADGHRVCEADTAVRALEELTRGVDVVLLDDTLPDAEPVGLLQKMRATDPDALIVLLTEKSSITRVVAAMQVGAFDCLCKPLVDAEVTAVIRRALAAPRPDRSQRLRHAQERAEHGVGRILGDSPEIRAVKDLVLKVARSRATTVLLGGESGVGKDMVARAIHAHSTRVSGQFVNITCSAIPESLLETELFGHEKGAFTDAAKQKIGLLEQADGGTVFLDEIAEMSLMLQSKLLRFLEERAFRRVGGSAEIRPDVRVIAATNRDLAAAVQHGDFREDLFYRVAVARIDIPPLRARSGDALLLCDHFLASICRELGKPMTRLDASARQLLRTYHWPGNVRELKNTLERAMLFSAGDSLGAQDLQLIPAAPASSNRVELPTEGIDLRALEQDMLVQALERSRWNHTRAARLLGLNRDQVRYRINKFGISSQSRHA